jgi:hypothetical protein
VSVISITPLRCEPVRLCHCPVFRLGAGETRPLILNWADDVEAARDFVLHKVEVLSIVTSSGAPADAHDLAIVEPVDVDRDGLAPLMIEAGGGVAPGTRFRLDLASELIDGWQRKTRSLDCVEIIVV